MAQYTEERFAFTVDTHLFRELGELLVGRESTALMELVKNAYDADATRVTVKGANLKVPESGEIVISDDGVGMTPEIFRSAFLRIAGRFKEQGDRKSPRFRRRYTGAKGVGRLSAHKLARRLELTSIPSRAIHLKGAAGGQVLLGIRASIDWEDLEDNQETLDDTGDGLSAQAFDPDSNSLAGTILRLSRIRQKWTSRSLTTFVQDVSSAYAPANILEPPPSEMIRDQPMLGQINPWTRGPKDPGFRIVFEGDFNVGESLLPQLRERANWLLEIESSDSGVTYAIEPMNSQMREMEDIPHYRFYVEHPEPQSGPFFRARIYAREGALGARTSALSRFSRANSGIRVYVEGFRVLPYGDPAGDDWLDLNRDYARKPRQFEIDLEAGIGTHLEPVDNEGFLTLGADQYFGGVFMTAEDSESLRPVVNREGFLHDDAFVRLRAMVRSGVDLLTRVRAAHNREARQRRLDEIASQVAKSSGNAESPPTVDEPPVPSAPHADRASNQATPKSRPTRQQNVTASLSLMREQVDGLRTVAITTPEVSPIADRLEKVVGLVEESTESDEEEATLRILAGVGLQLAAFIHEINGILGVAGSIRTIAETARSAPGADQRLKRILRDLDVAADRLVQSLSRQASYLVDVVGPDARRRRRRIALRDAADPSLQFLHNSLLEREIILDVDIEDDARTPPVFQAELTIIFTNLLTNALKAAGRGGRIRVRGASIEDGGVAITIENTGQVVNVDEGERWFKPFESTTVEMDVVLGQGMGLGLPITRRLLSEYGGIVKFVHPAPNYSTAIEVVIPGRKNRRQL